LDAPQEDKITVATTANSVKTFTFVFIVDFFVVCKPSNGTGGDKVTKYVKRNAVTSKFNAERSFFSPKNH
ncbi:MAG: hypothetical protein ACK438_11810, partial [Flavobacteriales bacterium]